MPLRRVKPPWVEIAIVALAIVLRLWALDLKPAHFDEGVNGWFADQMTQMGYFRYDPTNYHGPLHFYGVFISQTLFGRNLWALRLPAVLASVLAVWAILRFREFFGAGAARMAALAMAVSPAFVYYGRYSIHESALVLFLILTLLGMLGLWEKGERRFLWVLALGVTGMVLTKETYAIHVVCFALAAGVLWLWQKVVPSRPAVALARQEWGWREGGLAAVASAGVIVAFYSGFFLDFSRVPGLWQTFAAWFETGVEAGGHEKPQYEWLGLNFYWVVLMAWREWAGLAGLLACFWFIGPTDARLRYIAIYAGGALLAYSLIPYKTPWCLIAILWPFFLTGACAAQTLPALLRNLLWGLLVVAGFAASIIVNFVRYDHDDEPYAYVQTYREISLATDPILELARRDPRFYYQPGAVILESYYPLPWIFGDFTSVGYYNEESVPDTITASFVLTSQEAAERVKASLRGAYYRREFRLRSGVGQCVAYFRHPDYEPIFGGQPDLIGTAPE